MGRRHDDTDSIIEARRTAASHALPSFLDRASWQTVPSLGGGAAAMADDNSSSLFAVFFLSLYTLVLVPYTIYKVCSAASVSGEAVKPWLKVRSSRTCEQR